MLFFMLLQIACSSEQASCPSVSGASIVLGDDTSVEDTQGVEEDTGEANVPEALVGAWVSEYAAVAWWDGCAYDDFDHLSEAEWIRNFTVSEGGVVQWAAAPSEVFEAHVDDLGGFSMSGYHRGESSTFLTQFAGVSFYDNRDPEEAPSQHLLGGVTMLAYEAGQLVCFGYGSWHAYRAE